MGANEENDTRRKRSSKTPKIIAGLVCCIAVIIIGLLISNKPGFPTIDRFANYMASKGLTSAYDENIIVSEDAKISKYYKGSSLYEAFYASYSEYTETDGENGAAKDTFENNVKYYRNSYETIDFDTSDENSGRFHATNSSNSEVYVFYNENKIITIIGKTSSGEDMKEIVASLNL